MHTQPPNEPNKNNFEQRFKLPDEHTELELKYARVQRAFNKLTWYEQGLVTLYLEYGNYRAIQKATGIPHQSAWATVKDALAKMRKQIKKEMNDDDAI